MVICKLPEPAMVGLFLAMVIRLLLMMMEISHTINFKPVEIDRFKKRTLRTYVRKKVA